MQNSTSESSDQVSPHVSGHYTVTVTDTTDSSDQDDFVLDLSSLPCESDYLFDAHSNSDKKTLQRSIYDFDTVPKGTKRRFEVEDIPEVNISSGTSTSGYESDTEHDEEDMTSKKKKKKLRCYKYKAQRNPSINMTSGEKRKYSEEENMHQKKKRLKTSLPGEYDKLSSSDTSSSTNSDSSISTSDSSSDSSSSSSESSSDSSSCSSSCTDSSLDSSCSDNDTLNLAIPYKCLNSIQGIIPCAKSCACKVGQSRPPIPIERNGLSIQPLYKKLLQRRLLSTTNTFSHTCCNRKCYLNWEQNRISLGRMVDDYCQSGLRVDHFSWGQWKQTPEVDEKSDDDWFW
ncbi:uncharacterized protein LOC123545514 isoform X2 [Mercenaria mercenaria]|uniref:uncharacterized protein LOC123545514 isoform X2 n=1 Tax=Mercenaria mercenaria TaxID=6596 RepID=UPI00234F4167|nr:uncharacterized protein LOC123545514 isoform X2 [Mercenaria mercenaria]